MDKERNGIQETIQMLLLTRVSQLPNEEHSGALSYSFDSNRCCDPVSDLSLFSPPKVLVPLLTWLSQLLIEVSFFQFTICKIYKFHL